MSRTKHVRPPKHAGCKAEALRLKKLHEDAAAMAVRSLVRAEKAEARAGEAEAAVVQLRTERDEARDVRRCEHGNALPELSSGWCWCARAATAERYNTDTSVRLAQTQELLSFSHSKNVSAHDSGFRRGVEAAIAAMRGEAGGCCEECDACATVSEESMRALLPAPAPKVPDAE